MYYAFRRNGIAIPVSDPGPAHRRRGASRVARCVERVERAAAHVSKSSRPLDDAVLAELARSTRTRSVRAGEVIVRQGETGGSMFVIVRGDVVVSIDPGGREVARLEDGAFFGEMSLLTGAPRTATVRASADSDLLEITAGRIPHLHPRQSGCGRDDQPGGREACRGTGPLRSDSAASAVAEAPATFVDRVRRFLGL